MCESREKVLFHPSEFLINFAHLRYRCSCLFISYFCSTKKNFQVFPGKASTVVSFYDILWAALNATSR